MANEPTEDLAVNSFGIPILLGCIATGVLAAAMFSSVGAPVETGVKHLADDAYAEYEALEPSVIEAAKAQISKVAAQGKKHEKEPVLTLIVDPIFETQTPTSTEFNLRLEAQEKIIKYEFVAVHSIKRTGYKYYPFETTVEFKAHVTNRMYTSAQPVKIRKEIASSDLLQYMADWSRPSQEEEEFLTVPYQHHFLPGEFSKQTMELKPAALEGLEGIAASESTQKVVRKLIYDIEKGSWVPKVKPGKKHDDGHH